MLERVIFKIFRVVFWYGVFRFWCSVFGVFGHQLSGNTVLLQKFKTKTNRESGKLREIELFHKNIRYSDISLF